MISRDPRMCYEAVRSAILATAWLLVKCRVTADHQTNNYGRRSCRFQRPVYFTHSSLRLMVIQPHHRRYSPSPRGTVQKFGCRIVLRLISVKTGNISEMRQDRIIKVTIDN